MLFNSIDFVIFFPAVFILYWFVFGKNLRLQNLFVVVASFVFYGWWNRYFLILLVSSCVINYGIGVLMAGQEQKSKRKMLLWIAIVYNLGLLVVFKYLNFFIDSFTTAFTFLGFKISGGSLNLVMPVGISFFTFQALGYILDVYRRDFKATKDIVSFSAFVSFIPLILAGPIERAPHLVSQFYNKRKFDYLQATDGLRQILWGLFKKIVIADNCAELVNMVFNNQADYGGSTLVLGALFYAIQIYADFSGYSDVAIGVSKLLGFNVIRNFNSPYISTNVSDFWRRWHISLSSWLRDYLYTPLSVQLRNWQKTGVIFSLFVTFLLCGLWHGANYTFIVWGGLHGIALSWDALSFRWRKQVKKKSNPHLYQIVSWFLTFLFIVFTWIFFRSESLSNAIAYIHNMLSGLKYSWGYAQTIEILRDQKYLTLLFLVLIFLIIEWMGREKQYAIAHIGLRWKWPLRFLMYYGMLLLILWYSGNEQQFLYFKF